MPERSPHGAPGYAGAARYVESPVSIRDGNVITAPGSAPVSFTAEVFRAAGVDEARVREFTAMLATEFRALGERVR